MYTKLELATLWPSWRGAKDLGFRVVQGTCAHEELYRSTLLLASGIARVKMRCVWSPMSVESSIQCLSWDHRAACARCSRSEQTALVAMASINTDVKI